MKHFMVILLFLLLTCANSFAGYCFNGGKGCKNSLMITRYLADLADNNSGFAVVGSIGRAVTDTAPKDITAILISENASWNDNGKPTVIITGAIHGNEWATPEVCLGIAEYLLENKDNGHPARDDTGALINEEIIAVSGEIGDQTIRPRITSIKELLQTIQIIIIPVLNPGGYDYSHTPQGKKSYFGTGWRPNRRGHASMGDGLVCYQKNGALYATPPNNNQHCFLADYDDTADDGNVEEEELIICESIDGKTINLFEPWLNVASAEMFDAIYNSTNPARVVCASNQRRVWQEEWSNDEAGSVAIEKAKAEGYISESYGVDLNRNFQYKWDVTQNQKHLFIRSRSPSSRLYRGGKMISEAETNAMERLVAEKNVTALIDYHAGSTQVLYPYAYSTKDRAQENILINQDDADDFEVFRLVSEKIAALLNRHNRQDDSIVNFSAGQNYNDTSVGSGVARDCYYKHEKIAAINIEVHEKKYTYEDAEFKEVVPKICKTNVPGAIWFLFWAAGLH